MNTEAGGAGIVTRSSATARGESVGRRSVWRVELRRTRDAGGGEGERGRGEPPGRIRAVMGSAEAHQDQSSFMHRPPMTSEPPHPPP